MNKKLLLSAMLSSTLLASTASAADENRDKLPPKDDQYEKDAMIGPPAERLSAIVEQIINLKNIQKLNKMVAESMVITRRLKKEQAEIEAEENELDAEENELDANLTQGATNLGANLKQGAINSYGLNILNNHIRKLNEVKKYTDLYIETKNIEQNVNTNFTNLESQLAAEDQTIRALVDEKNTLNAIANKTAEQNARLLDLTNQILSSDRFNKLRNSPQTQEILKQNIELIRMSLAENKNSVLYKIVGNNLKSFTKNEISKYLVLDPSNSAELPAVQQADNVAAEALIDTVLSTRIVLDSRIGDLGGISSGDVMKTYGIWAKGTFSRAAQKARGKKTQGYKIDSEGITIGVDAGDESLVGIAYSFFKNDVKNKTLNKNKEGITSHAINAYGKYTATPEIFISGQAQFGMAEIKKERATGDTANNIATAKPKAIILGTKAEIGYNFDAIENVHLIPAVGVAYTDVKVKGYKESGGGLNREVGKINASRNSGIASLTAKYFVDIGTIKLTPEVHANIDYAFNTKNGKTVVTLIKGIPSISTPSQKLKKGLYNVGTSIRAVQSGMFEFTAGYDFSFAKKFQSHTGALKVRVNL